MGHFWNLKMENFVKFLKILDQSANPVQSVIQVQSSLTKIVKDPGNERIRTGPNSDLIFSFQLQKTKKLQRFPLTGKKTYFG